jgi:predicted metal-dependent hydrolase
MLLVAFVIAVDFALTASRLLERKILFDTYNFKVEVLHKKKLKNSYIQVLKDKTVLVKTSVSSKQYIQNFIDTHLNWIQKELLKMENVVSYEEELHTKEYVIDRMVYFSQEMDLKYEQIKFRKMKSRWGSCSSKRSITLNTHLLKLPLEYVDYILVHELAHIKHMNHSKEFHALVEKFIPNQKEIRKKFKTVSVV